MKSNASLGWIQATCIFKNVPSNQLDIQWWQSRRWLEDLRRNIRNFCQRLWIWLTRCDIFHYYDVLICNAKRRVRNGYQKRHVVPMVTVMSEHSKEKWYSDYHSAIKHGADWKHISTWMMYYMKYVFINSETLSVKVILSKHFGIVTAGSFEWQLPWARLPLVTKKLTHYRFHRQGHNSQNYVLLYKSWVDMTHLYLRSSFGRSSK